MRTAFLALALGGCATASPERILRLQPALGSEQRVAVTTAIHHGDRPPLRLELSFTATVDEVTPVKGIRYRIDALELALPPGPEVTAALVEKLAERMAWAEAVRGTGVVSDRGSTQAFVLPLPSGDADAATCALEGAAGQAISVLTAELGLVGIPLPDGPVAPGASWTGARTGELDQIRVRADARYQLLAADETRVRVGVRAELSGDGVSGGFEGELTYDLKKPFPVAAGLSYRLRVVGRGEVDDRLEVNAP